MRIRFILRKLRINQAGVCPVNCRITIGGIKANEFSVNLSVDPLKWDSKSQRLKGNTQGVQDINRRLDIIKSELDNIYLLNRSRGIYLSATEVKDIYSGKTVDNCKYSILTKKYLEELQLKERSPKTLMRYRRCFQYLGTYLKDDLNVASIEKRKVAGFWNWLKGKGYHNDYCNKIVQACIGLFAYAIREGLIDYSPFAGVSLKWHKEIDVTCLTNEEVESIKNHNWSDKLQRVADAFLFMCYTGLHIGDYQDVREESQYTYQGREFMKIRREKTGVEAMFPLEDYALFLIEKYGGIDKLPRISDQKCNEYLKVIAELVGITKTLTNKIARKTFTDRCQNEYGLSDEVVATMLGHTTTNQLKFYGRTREKRILNEWKQKVDTNPVLVEDESAVPYE